MSFWEKLTGKKKTSDPENKDTSQSDQADNQEKSLDNSSPVNDMSPEQQKAIDEILKPPQS